MPVFLPLATLVSSLVGYQLPVACQQLSQGSTVSANITISLGGQEVSGPVSLQTSHNELGVTVVDWFPAGSTVTVTAGGQTVTLPTIPDDTTDSHEATPPPSYPTGLTPVLVPMLIGFDQSVCDGWNSADPAQRGVSLIVAIHESMHAHYAESNEALTQCRALQLFPTVLQSLFPVLSSPGAEPVSPGAAPTRPALAHKASVWKRAHPTAWKRILAHWRQATTLWNQSYSQWLQAESQWRAAYTQWAALNNAFTAQTSEEAAMTAAAQLSDAALPPQYHGATC